MTNSIPQLAATFTAVTTHNKRICHLETQKERERLGLERPSLKLGFTQTRDGMAICGLAIRIVGDSGVAAGCLIDAGANHCDEHDYRDDAECCGLLESRQASPRFALATPSEGCSGIQCLLDQWLE